MEPQPPPLHLRIRYDADHEGQALQLARSLFARFDETIDSLALIPDAREQCAVDLNGRVVHSQSQSGRPPRVSDVVAAASSEQ